jgi:O-antigen ligase
MSATSLYTFEPAWAKKRARQSRQQIVPFALFFILICTPGFTNIASVNFSIALFPVVIFGYFRAARENFTKLLPGARRIATLILSVMLVLCFWELVASIGADVFLRVFRPLSGHASGLAIVVAILALSGTAKVANRTRRVCMGILTIALALTYFIGDRGYHDRFPGMFKHPNQLGPVAAMAALFMFGEVISNAGRKRVFPVFGLIAAVYAMMLSGSKTNLVVLTVLIFISVFLLAFQRSEMRQSLTELYRNLILALGFVVAGGVVLAATNERAFSVLSELMTTDSDVVEYRTVVARDELWRESIDEARLHPLTGVGAGQFMRNGKTEHSHNVFMDALRTTGIPGFALTIAFVLAVLWYVVGAYRAARLLARHPKSTRMQEANFRGPLVGSLMALVSYILSNQMSDSFGPSTIPFFYMFFAFSLTYFLPGDGAAAWAPSKHDSVGR